jgi:lipopolysaccharide/colanic/teichoic acid biosynthesis glycosyltransferase
VLLLAALPVMILAAVAVLATSAGPMLTRSGRIGPDGRVVFLRQFRTTYRHENGHGALPGRSRAVTPVGWVLQRSGIARLPMLADVWEGKIGLAAALRA